MIHAYAVAGPRRRPSRMDTGVIGILLIVFVAVNGFAADLALAAYNFDNDVASNQLIPDEPTPAPTRRRRRPAYCEPVACGGLDPHHDRFARTHTEPQSHRRALSPDHGPPHRRRFPGRTDTTR